MPFDPDAYLKKKSEPTFDPDAYLATKAPTPEPAAPVANDSSLTIQSRGPNPGLLGMMDRIKNFPSDVQAFVDSQAENVPFVGALGKRVGASVNTWLGNDASVEDSLKRQNEESEQRNKEHPIASTLGALSLVPIQAASPIGSIGGIKSLAVNAGDMLTRSGIADEKVGTIKDTGSNSGNIIENLLLEGGLGTLAKGLSKVTDSDLWRKASVAAGKKTLNPTTKEMTELGVKSDDLTQSVENMLDAGDFSKPILTRENLYNNLRGRMSKLGEDMDTIASDWGQGISRGDLSDTLVSKGKDARTLGQKDLQSAYNHKAEAFLPEEVVQAQRDLTKVDKALNKPRMNFDATEAGNQAVERGQKIAGTRQEIHDLLEQRRNAAKDRMSMGELDADEETLADLKARLRQEQIDNTVGNLDDRGNLLTARQALKDSERETLENTRDNLNEVIGEGRDQVLSTSQLREARKMEDARAYPSQFAVDKDKADIAQTLRELERESINDPALRSYYDQLKSQYSKAATVDELAAKAAGREEAKTLLGTIGRNTGAGLGAATGAAVAGPAGAVVGAALGSYGQQVVNKYGNQLAAFGANKMHNVLKNEGWAKVLSQAADRGGQPAMNSAHYLLMQRDPKYREAFNSGEDK